MSIWDRLVAWTYTVTSNDLIVPIVSLALIGALAALAGCDRAAMCYCLESEYSFRVPFLVATYTASVVLESVFAENLLSWFPGFPFLILTFLSTHEDLPLWLYGSTGRDDCGSGGEECDNSPSLHLAFIVIGTACEAVIAVYRCWKHKLHVTLAVVAALVGLMTIFFTIEHLVDGVAWLTRARAILSPANLAITRVVAAATIEGRRRQPPDPPRQPSRGQVEEERQGVPLLALTRGGVI
jgi:hypothetical protein